MIQKDLGFVLKKHNFRETSVIATIYTSRFGKIKGILKGFYSFKKEFASALDILSLNEFVFYPKKSEIWLISHVDLVSDYFFLSKSISKFRVAAVLVNFIEKVMQLWDSNDYIFKLLKDCLNLLQEERELKILYIFLIKFLTFSGFKPGLNSCMNCGGVLSGEIFFSASGGGLVCRQCGKRIKDVRDISREASQSFLYIQNNDFPLVCRINPALKCEEEIFYILKEFLLYHFDFDCLLQFNDYKQPAYNVQ